MNEQELIQSCEHFMKLWHENGRASFEAYFTNLNYDQAHGPSMKVRKLWICIDRGGSGSLMVRKADGQVFNIKAYGVPHLKKPCGFIGDLITKYMLANVDGTEVRPELRA
jgi:hypothetical protein